MERKIYRKKKLNALEKVIDNYKNQFLELDCTSVEIEADKFSYIKKHGGQIKKSLSRAFKLGKIKDIIKFVGLGKAPEVEIMRSLFKKLEELGEIEEILVFLPHTIGEGYTGGASYKFFPGGSKERFVIIDYESKINYIPKDDKFGTYLPYSTIPIG